MMHFNSNKNVVVLVWEQAILVLVTMAPFLRIAFNSYDLGILPPLTDPPFCAIKMKEALTTGENIFLAYAEVATSA